MTLIVDPNRWQPLRRPTDALAFRRRTGGASCRSRCRPPAVPAAPASGATAAGLRAAGRRSSHERDAGRPQEGDRRVLGRRPRPELRPVTGCSSRRRLRRDGHTLDEDVKMFFALGNALMDAGIAAGTQVASRLRAARHRDPFPLRRAEIRWGDRPGHPADRRREWQTVHSHAAVRRVASGHSTFSAAAAEVLQRFTGSDSCAHGHVPRRLAQIEPGLAPAGEWT